MDKELQKLKEDLQINRFDNDYIIIADGSGSNLSKSCGFHCYVHNGISTEELSGFLSKGTNQLAEIMPFIHALWYIKNLECDGAKLKILCITDSEVIVKQGKQIYARCPMFSIIEYFEKDWQIDWKWFARNSNKILSTCDEKSKEMRKLNG